MKVLNALLVCSILLSTTTIGFSQTETPDAPKATSPTMAFGLLDGTPVKLRLARTVSSKDAKTGETIDFEVLEDIKVGDVIVAPRGGIALGTVTNAHPSGHMGKGGKLDIGIDHLRLVDGEKVALRAVKEGKGGSHTGAMTGAIVASAILFFPAAPLFLFMKGKNITIPKGTEVTAYVNGDSALNPKQFATVQDPADAGSADPGAVPASSGTSTISIKSTPTGADIEVDGKFVGSTPSALQLKIGEHKITIKKTGFDLWERSIDLGAGSGVNIDATLDKTPTP
jgi:hypothetical protein